MTQKKKVLPSSSTTKKPTNYGPKARSKCSRWGLPRLRVSCPRKAHCCLLPLVRFGDWSCNLACTLRAVAAATVFCPLPNFWFFVFFSGNAWYGVRLER